MYKVIKYFTDLHDKNHPYNVGDVYPREGIKVTQKRIDSLAGDGNRRGEPLIELVEEETGTDVVNTEAVDTEEADTVEEVVEESGEDTEAVEEEAVEGKVMEEKPKTTVKTAAKVAAKTAARKTNK